MQLFQLRFFKAEVFSTPISSLHLVCLFLYYFSEKIWCKRVSWQNRFSCFHFLGKMWHKKPFFYNIISYKMNIYWKKFSLLQNSKELASKNRMLSVLTLLCSRVACCSMRLLIGKGWKKQNISVPVGLLC